MTAQKQIGAIVDRMRAVAKDALRYRDGAVSAERVRTWAREIEATLKRAGKDDDAD